jgi:hypothetical protein
MNKIICFRLLWVETHLMMGVSFIHALKCVAISPDLKIGEIKNPGKQDRALAQLNLNHQLGDHFNI